MAQTFMQTVKGEKSFKGKNIFDTNSRNTKKTQDTHPLKN